MDYKPRQSYKGNSYTYKKKRIFWFNSAFNDDFTLVDGKIDDITFNVPPFQTYNQNNLKMLTFVREETNPKPIIIKLKEPYLVSRSVVNTDKESHPIIYANHTGHEGMTSKGNNFSLTPQQIPKFVFKFDENFIPILSTSSGVLLYQRFNYTGTIQTFTIPTGLTSVNIYCWGAGGGASTYNSRNGTAGVGGFVKATLNVSGMSSLKIIVGQGGRSSDEAFAFGGGGSNKQIYGGGGGGLSGVFVDNANMTILSSYYVNPNATPILIAGGGGGNGYSLFNPTIQHGGNGGGLTANDGSGIRYGGGGSQTTGGLASSVAFGTQGTNGSKFVGGNGGDYGAGGGGGYFGGGAGGVESYIIGSGGGGSSFINTTSFTITNISNLKEATNGTNNVPASFETYYQSGIGKGGTTDPANNYGGNGLVVIEYLAKRNDGIKANETLVQATNSSIPVVENSKYLINYENPINIPTGTYETFFSNGSILFRDKKFPRPWGAYFAEDWSGTTLLDSSGNGRHATTSGTTIIKSSGFGNGANGNINFISGGTGDRITWPTGSIPTTYTILGLTRYTGGWNRRILQGSVNWLLGHWDANVNPTGLRGVAFNTTVFLTPATSIGNITDWLCSISKNSGTTPSNTMMDGVGVATTTGTAGGYTLGINSGAFGVAEASDWAMSVVLIWDTALSDAQMFELNRLVDNYKQTGRSLKNDLWLNIDYSYPILKDANGDTINPFAWYKFDTSNNLGVDDMGVHNLSNPNGVAFSTDFIKGSGCASFDGTNDHLIKDSSFNLNSKSWSVSLWCKKTSNSRTDFLFELGTGNTTYTTLTCGYENTNNILFGVYSDDLRSSSTYNDAGTWVHLCFTFLTGTKQGTIYRNGVQIAQKNFSQELNTNDNFRIGKLTTNYYQGLVDDFRIYQTTLSATQVSELYNGRVAIYNPPNFEIGLELEDTNLVLDNTISPYK